MLRSRFWLLATISLIALLLATACAEATPTPTTVPAPAATPTPRPPSDEPTATPRSATTAPLPPTPTPTPIPAPEIDFFQGKTIRILVGFGPGGGFDTYTRLLARHLPRYIPGEPNILVQNRPGAGSLVTANVLWEAKPDGLTIGIFNFTQVTPAVLGDPAARFDPTRFEWIGEVTAGQPSVTWAWHEVSIDSPDDWRNLSEPIKFGMSGVPQTIPARIMDFNGFPAKIVLGYGGSAEVFLAMRRGEIDWTSANLSSVLSNQLDLYESNQIFPLTIEYPHPSVADLEPVMYYQDMGTSKLGQQLIDFDIARGNFIRTFTAPPNTPEDRVAVLRRAFQLVGQDLQFQAEAERIGLAPSFAGHEEILAAVQTMGDASPEVIKIIKDWLGVD